MAKERRQLDPRLDMERLPTHIAIIMDGNGRWATKRLLPRVAGHVKGVDAVRKIVEACVERGVEYLTLFAFSSENWRRPADEVSYLMGLFVTALERCGGSVSWHRPVHAIRRDGALFELETRRGPVRARAVVANVLPQALARLLALDEDAVREPVADALGDLAERAPRRGEHEGPAARVAAQRQHLVGDGVAGLGAARVGHALRQVDEQIGRAHV